MNKKGDPKDILDRQDDAGYLRALIERAETATTTDMNQTRVASTVLLAASIRRGAEASERHARGLTRATWALFGATVALVAVAIASCVGWTG